MSKESLTFMTYRINPLMSKESFQKVTKTMYPSWLKLGNPEYEGRNVHYLDMPIWPTTADHTVRWHSKLYDKKTSMVHAGLKLNRFPHPTSKLSTRCEYGVITSQLHGYNVACTQLRHFMQPATDLHVTYLNKGYTRRTVDKCFEQFIRRQMPTVSPLTVTRAYTKTICVVSSSRERLGTYLPIPTTSTPPCLNIANNPFHPNASYSPNAATPPSHLGLHDPLHIHDASVGQAFTRT